MNGRPPVPREREETLRRQLVDLLEGEEMTLKELSAAVGRPEKELTDHLAHVRRSLQAGPRQLEVLPASCRRCGFVFEKRRRDRLAKPGKCPVCRGESIAPPRFTVRAP